MCNSVLPPPEQGPRLLGRGYLTRPLYNKNHRASSPQLIGYLTFDDSPSQIPGIPNVFMQPESWASENSIGFDVTTPNGTFDVHQRQDCAELGFNTALLALRGNHDPAIATERENAHTAGLQTISPNPATDELRVELAAVTTEESTTLTLTDLFGREVRTVPLVAGTTAVTVDVRTLPDGLYVARLTGAGGLGMRVQIRHQ